MLYNPVRKKDPKNIYIVITHIQQPPNDEGKVGVSERCEFVDNLKNRHRSTASVILDYLNEKVVKNRSEEGSYPEFVKYLEKNYPQQMGELKKEFKSE
jgi:hypothetical protein